MRFEQLNKKSVQMKFSSLRTKLKSVDFNTGGRAGMDPGQIKERVEGK